MQQASTSQLQHDYSQQQEFSTYEQLLNCCGDFFGFWRIWLPIPCCFVDYPYVTIRQGLNGVKEKFGRYSGTLSAGLHYVNPCTETYQVKDIRTSIMQLSDQRIVTKDSITVTIDGQCYYRTINARDARYNSDNVEEQIKNTVYAALRHCCGSNTLQDLIEKRYIIAEQIEQEIQGQTEKWGVKIEEVFMKDIILMPQMSQQVAAAAQQRRQAEAKIISAKADVECSKLMKDVGTILESKCAMQIRYLETIQNIARHPNPKVIFMPLEQDATV